MLDTRWRIADHIFVGLIKLLEHAPNAILRQGLFIARLRGRQDVELIAALIPNQRLIEIGLPIDDIGKVIDDAALAAHDQIEIAQPDVEIDHHRSMATLR